jgi:hypothetical protein
MNSEPVVETPVPDVKPGYKSSEYSALLLPVVSALLNQKLGLGISDTVLMAIIGLAGGFIVQRGWIKTR